jgi:hypothetical protein
VEGTSTGIQVDVGPGTAAGEVTVDRNSVLDTPLGLRLSSAAAGVTLHARQNRLQENATGLRIDSGSTSTFDIASNTVVGNEVGVLSTSATTPDNAAVTVAQNNIYGNSQQDWRAESVDAQRPSLNAENNFWGTTTPAVIDARIFDSADDPTRTAVDYTPFLTSASATAPPAAPPETVSPGGPPATTNATTATIPYSSPQAGSTFQCRLDTPTWSACPASPVSLNVQEGTHTFEIRAVDPAGIADPTPILHLWRVDSTPPQTSITSGPTGTVRATSATFAFVTTEGGVGSGFECRLDGAGWAPCTTPVSLAGLSQGSHTFRVRARDRAGNVDGTEAVRTWIVDTAPPRSAGSGTPAPAAAAVDLAAARRMSLRRFLRGITARANRAGTIRSRFTIGRRDARKLRSGTLFATGRATLSAAGAVRVKPKLTRRARRALRRVRRLRVTITTTFTPASGAKVTTRDVVVLSR